MSAPAPTGAEAAAPPRTRSQRARDLPTRAAEWSWAHMRRIHHGTKKPHNWVALFKFGLVGGTGYVVNLIVFAILTAGLGVGHLLAAVGAFCVAVTNNFLWNRHWTFDAGAGKASFQAPRFFAVSLFGLGVNLAVLELLVTGAGLSELPAQAIAVAAATPANFIGNKLWTFD